MFGAVLQIACNYPGTSAALRGCINDVESLHNILSSHDTPDITVLVDDASDVMDVRGTPTKENILNSMWAVVRACNEAHAKGENSHVFVQYSGHGVQVRDRSGDEKDGLDEALAPTDYASAGMIKDDDMHECFLALLPPTCTVFMLLDCCHSGTMSDLRYQWDARRKTSRLWSKTATQKTRQRGTIRRPVVARVMAISGSMDRQTSSDAFIAASQEFEGAMTRAFVNAYGALGGFDSSATMFLDKMRAYLKQKGYPQVPQITTSFNMTTRTPLFFTKRSYVETKSKPPPKRRRKNNNSVYYRRKKYRRGRKSQ
jgi:metacaspase-1